MPLLGTRGAASAQGFGFTNATGPVTGQQAYITAGSYSWVAPAGVTSVSVVSVGGGGAAGTLYSCFARPGGGGAELKYKNNITVTPGNSYSVVVGTNNSGASGGASSFNTSTVIANGGIKGSSVDGTGGAGGSGGTGDGGGNGGPGGDWNSTYYAAGGAAGYSGNGGSGATASAGAGGGGSGGSQGTRGGGVGILGQGCSGAAPSVGAAGNPGSGGSGFTYGGGGGGAAGDNAIGGPAALRIIWPGTTRSFPSTNTGDL